MKTRLLQKSSNQASFLSNQGCLLLILLLYSSLASGALGQTKQWNKVFGGTDHDVLNSVQQTSDGGYILGGSSNSGKGGDKTAANKGFCDEEFVDCRSDFWVVKLNSEGRIEWDRTFGGSDYDELASFQQTSDGGYILAGNSASNSSEDKTQDNLG